MTSFKQRSGQKELLDGNDIPFEDIKQNMHELDRINHWLGGHKITIEGFRKLIPYIPKNDIIRVAEIGCGGGDNLQAIKKWSDKNNIPVQLTGIDINEACIQYANEQSTNKDIQFICSDYKNVQFQQQPYIIFSSLFCHHFTNDELVEMITWLQQNCATGFFINDLHRHPLAYYSIKLLTQIFSKSYLVKNDAPLSVQRSFVKSDWEDIFKKSSVQQYSIQWQWAFRWLITARVLL